MSTIRKAKSSIDFRGRQFVITHDELPTSGLLSSEILYPPRGATLALLRMLPSTQVEAALDVGTGHGLLAIALTTISNRVTATDINQNFIETAEQNAVFNNCNIEFKLGSLFEPVESETFDVIVSNLPFVIDDVLEDAYRKSPLSGNGLLHYILNETPRFLSPDGLSVFLLTWLSDEHGDFDQSDIEFQGQTWVGIREVLTLGEYVDVWMKDACSDDIEMRSKWIETLSSSGYTHASFGFIVIRNSSPSFTLIEDLRAASRLPEADEISERLDAALLSQNLQAVDILSAQFTPTTLQGWRGDVSLDAILVKVREGMSVSQIVESVSQEYGLDEADVLAYCLAGVKQLVDWGLLSRKSPMI